MQLVINTYGAFLRKSGDCFAIKVDDRNLEVSVNKVQSILITTSAYLSTDAIKMAIENNIDIVFLDDYGDPFGRVWHSKLGSTTLIRRKQLEIMPTEEGFEMAKEWVIKKLENNIRFIKSLAHSRPEQSEQILNQMQTLENNVQSIQSLKGTINEKRAELMGLEGSAGKVYFEILSSVMPEKYKFNGRSKQPAKDEFNCTVNYAYGVLYGLVEKSCIIAGLDPYLGFIHTDNYNKKSLVFDLIEMFRIYADSTVVYLFTGRKIQTEFFDVIDSGGYTLNKEGKAFLLENFNKYLDESVRYQSRNIKRRDIIQFECHKIANKLIEKETLDSNSNLEDE